MVERPSGDEVPAEGTRAHELLLAVVAAVRAEGRVDLSLRQLAALAGTSHRMLAYYFGTREQLLGQVMRRLSADYIAKFDGRRPTTRVDTIRSTWSMFRDPNNRLQTQLLFTLANAAAEQPGLQVPAITDALDNFAAALTHFGVQEGLSSDRAAREARLIVATLLGLYLDDFVSGRPEQVELSYQALIEWVQRSVADPS